jgi:hypothetical protein
MATPSIDLLPELIAALPVELQSLCERLFFVERIQGSTIIPPPLQPWVMNQFGSMEAVTHQAVLRVVNRLTLETALFNSLRARRPHDPDPADGAAPSDLDAVIAASAGANDIFHDPINGTTADVFERIRGRYCISAYNIAKYDGWHGLVIFDEFHPLRFNQAQLLDYFDVALRWLDAAHQMDPAAQYPLIMWNCLWKAGASITHGHLQMTLSRGMAYGQVERWRRAAAEYRRTEKSDLFADLGRLHAALDLTFTNSADISGYATLTPLKDRELVLHASIDSSLMKSGPDRTALRTALVSLWDVTYRALRSLIDDQGVRSFNLAVYLLPYGQTVEVWDDLPICVRIVDRGDPLVRAVNIGAMELFAGSVITADPFEVAEQVRLSQTVHI